MAALTRLVGLARRSGNLAIGHHAVVAALKRRRLHLLIFAGDCSAQLKEKMLARSRELAYLEAGSKQDWGALCNRDEVALLGIMDKHLADGILSLQAAAQSEPTAGSKENETEQR